MMRRSNTLLLSLALCLTALAPAHAADPPPGSSSTPESDKADALFRDGNVLYKQQKFAEAKALYESAYRLKASHDIAANLAYAEMRLGDNRSAAEHLSVAVRLWPPTGKEDKRKYAVERLQTAKAEVFTLTVGVGVDRAEVFVDGKSVGLSPLPGEIFLVPGSHMLVAKLGGYQDAKLNVEAIKGEARTVALELPASPPVPALTASAIASSPPVPTGSTRVPPPPVPPNGPKIAVVVTGGITAGAALIAGVALFAVAGGKGSNADQKLTQLNSVSAQLCPKSATTGACADLFSLRQDQQSFHNAGVVLLVGGSAVAVGTLAYALWPRGKRATADALLVPVVSTSGAGIWLHGTF